MLGRPEEDMGTCVHADESQPPQDLGSLREKLGRVHADRIPCLLRTSSEVQEDVGRHHAARSPEPPQVLRGGFRKLWARIYADRSP